MTLISNTLVRSSSVVGAASVLKGYDGCEGEGSWKWEQNILWDNSSWKQLKVIGRQAEGHKKTLEIHLPKFFLDQRKEYGCKGQRRYCSYLDVRRQEFEQCGWNEKAVSKEGCVQSSCSADVHYLPSAPFLHNPCLMSARSEEPNIWSSIKRMFALYDE